MRGFDKKKIKAVFVDLDGTIMHLGALCPGVEETLGKVSDLGYEVIIATGRQLMDIPAEVLSMRFVNYLVTMNGAGVLINKNEKYISRTPLCTSLIAKLLELTRGIANYEHLLNDYTTILSTECDKRTWEHLDKIFPEKRINEFKKLLKSVDSPADYIRENSIIIDKIVFNFRRPEHCNEILEKMNNLFEVETVLVDGTDIELTLRGVNKGVGVVKLAEYLGIDMCDTVAIGDSGNDAEMLKVAGFSIAMENSSKELKSLAHMVAPHVLENGAVRILEELFL